MATITEQETLKEEQKKKKRGRGRPKLEVPEPSQELKKLLNELASTFEKVSVLIQKIYGKARDEGFTPKQAYNLIKERSNKAISPRQLRRLIPSEAKEIRKTTSKAIEQHSSKITREEKMKSMTKEEVASLVLVEIMDVVSNPALGNLAKVRAIQRIINRVNKEGTL